VKILLVTPMPPRGEAPGAIPILLNAQLRGLSLRHDVTVATVAGPASAELNAVDALTQLGIEVHAVRRTEPVGMGRWYRRVRLVRRWAGSGAPRRAIWFFEPEMQHLLDRLLAERRFDVVAAEDNATALYTYRTASARVLTEHEVRQPRPFRLNAIRTHGIQGAFAEVDWRRWRGYQTGVWRKFDLLQVFTQRDAQALRTLAPELAGRVRINPFGVELPSAFDGDTEQGRLLFAGNFTHRPNVEAALWLGKEIMPLVRRRFEGARLTIVGIRAPREVLGLAAADIDVLGFVPRVEPFIAGSAVVLAPLRTGGGMRMKVVQAMAHGKAVVTTPLGAEGLAASGEAPPLAVAPDAETFADAVAWLLGDESARRELGHRARSYIAANHSPEAYARRLEANYAEAIARRAGDAC
jgi:polysaccharide biosynthesis protein PslH